MLIWTRIFLKAAGFRRRALPQPLILHDGSLARQGQVGERGPWLFAETARLIEWVRAKAQTRCSKSIGQCGDEAGQGGQSTYR